MEMISISKDEYEKLKMQANIDVDLLKQLMGVNMILLLIMLLWTASA